MSRQTVDALRQVSGRMVEAADFLERGTPALLEPVYAQRLRTQCGKLDDVLGELWERLPAPPYPPTEEAPS